MGIHPKIGITGLPRSGKSAVMEKVVSMLADERVEEMRARGDDVEAANYSGNECEPWLKWRARRIQVYQLSNRRRSRHGHKNIDSRTRVWGYGIDPEAWIESRPRHPRSHG
ncbi:MAG: hypothetical protein Ct9H90mP16_15520 [Candidatus Poseidoniales archaeon]|nr:MAG: hypothetical protein Ct9H90mP16_15520 [Candidatus Poseidoniales archaeon]